MCIATINRLTVLIPNPISTWQLLLQGKTYKYIADDVAEVDDDAVGHTMRGHRQPVTCVGISGDEKFAYSRGKDSVVCQYDVETGKTVHKWKGDKAGKSGHFFFGREMWD